MGAGLLASRPQRRAAVAVAAILGAAGFLPLFGGPGYEHALASGLVVPGAAAIATSLELGSGEPPAPLACVGRGILSGLALAAVAFATALLHGLRVGFCDLGGGALGFALTAGAGSVLGGAWGAVVAEGTRGRTGGAARVILALSLPVAGVVVSVLRFYTSPMIFAFDPFVGYFSGTLYDTVIDAGEALFSYRLGSLASLLALVFFASVLSRGPRGQARLVPLRGQPGALTRAALGALALAVSLTVTVRGAELGHWETPATIAAALGASLSGPRCDVILPDSVLPEDAALTLKDCEEELAAVERALGTKGPARVRAYFFRDGGEKKRLMGAGDTYIAKPWREEVYLQLGAYPHPVLGHELAHVVAGSFGRGPFRIAGGFGGLWPNPGLIEGVAVAASPDDDELTDEEWARALADLGTLPPMRSIFSFDFLAGAADKSYTVAGAFVHWVMGRFGVDAVRAWYGGGALEAITGRSWAQLDQDFRAAIAGLSMTPEAATYAKARFERSGLFSRVCPHVVDGLRRQADACRDAHETGRASALYDEVLARDPHDWSARFSLGMLALRFEGAGPGELESLVKDPEQPRTWKDRTLDALADDALRAGEFERAAKGYEDLAARTLDEDFGRMEDVKERAARDPEARAAVTALLVGPLHRGGDFALAASLLGAWEERTPSPIAEFLLGKNLSQRGQRAEGAAFLDRLLARGVYPTPRIGREALRDRAIDACAAGDTTELSRLRTIATREGGPFEGSHGRRAALLGLLDRCTAR